MRQIKCYTQAELDAAVKNLTPGDWISCYDGKFEISGSAQVTAYNFAQVTAFNFAQVRAYNFAQVTAFNFAQVRAFNSAQVRAFDSAQVTAFNSAQVRAYNFAQVTAFNSAQVTAFNSAQVRAYNFAQVTAYGKNSVVSVHGKYAKVTGQNIITIQPVATLDEWFGEYGLDVLGGVVTLFKALDANFNSSHSFNYAPGSVPVAPDWDGGIAECGGGLHFCPTPGHALSFQSGVKFAACPVRVEDIAFHTNAEYPTKVKAKGCCAPVWECDINGKRIEEAK
jgi:hypothetical protein